MDDVEIILENIYSEATQRAAWIWIIVGSVVMIVLIILVIVVYFLFYYKQDSSTVYILDNMTGTPMTLRIDGYDLCSSRGESVCKVSDTRPVAKELHRVPHTVEIINYLTGEVLYQSSQSAVPESTTRVIEAVPSDGDSGIEFRVSNR